MSTMGTSEPSTGEIGVDLGTGIDIIGGGTPGIPSPTVQAVALYGNVVCVRVALNVLQETEMVAVSLYRSLTPVGPWTGPLDSCQVDPFSLTTDLIDTKPLFGCGVYYAALSSTVSDASTDLSSAPFLFSAAQPT